MILINKGISYVIYYKSFDIFFYNHDKFKENGHKTSLNLSCRNIRCDILCIACLWLLLSVQEVLTHFI